LSLPQRCFSSLFYFSPTSWPQIVFFFLLDEFPTQLAFLGEILVFLPCPFFQDPFPFCPFYSFVHRLVLFALRTFFFPPFLLFALFFNFVPMTCFHPCNYRLDVLFCTCDADLLPFVSYSLFRSSPPDWVSVFELCFLLLLCSPRCVELRFTLTLPRWPPLYTFLISSPTKTPYE